MFNDFDNENNILNEEKEWEFEDKLSKEFEAIGFYISNHPLISLKMYLMNIIFYHIKSFMMMKKF